MHVMHIYLHCNTCMFDKKNCQCHPTALVSSIITEFGELSLLI